MEGGREEREKGSQREERVREPLFCACYFCIQRSEGSVQEPVLRPPLPSSPGLLRSLPTEYLTHPSLLQATPLIYLLVYFAICSPSVLRELRVPACRLIPSGHTGAG